MHLEKPVGLPKQAIFSINSVLLPKIHNPDQNSVKIQLTHLSKARKFMLKMIEGLTLEQLNALPKGHRNNIVWNIAHLVVTQQLLCYRLSGLPCLVSDEWIEAYRKGTFPTEKISFEQFEEIKRLFIELPLRLESDLAAGLFKTYAPYTTSVGIVLSNIEEAIRFNAFHEGIHLGVLLALKKGL